ncbi:MarR family winged helix-turn-helix transcriptional regulator [Butyrivibrio sp. AE2032]|uniref:MarR family winged helix-turn-helix transcriptional regulator n=1 Tax=Butyrivibrio sp. AE2032 TaxID=1458463 RepID=UPI000552CC9D|nr:MarR family transcriptional regulator [Butyrivibrio sp. AE2032]
MKTKESMKLDSQLCFPLYAAARKVVNLYTPYLKPLGITYTQYIMFLVLWEEDSVKVSDLCRRLRLDTGTVTPMLKNTEKQGLIKRTRSEEDERVVVVTLTEEGKALYNKAKDIPEKVGSCVRLSKEDAVQLYKILYSLLDS